MHATCRPASRPAYEPGLAGRTSWASSGNLVKLDPASRKTPGGVPAPKLILDVDTGTGRRGRATMLDSLTSARMVGATSVTEKPCRSEDHGEHVRVFDHIRRGPCPSTGDGRTVVRPDFPEPRDQPIRARPGTTGE